MFLQLWKLLQTPFFFSLMYTLEHFKVLEKLQSPAAAWADYLQALSSLITWIWHLEGGIHIPLQSIYEIQPFVFLNTTTLHTSAGGWEVGALVCVALHSLPAAFKRSISQSLWIILERFAIMVSHLISSAILNICSVSGGAIWKSPWTAVCRTGICTLPTVTEPEPCSKGCIPPTPDHAKGLICNCLTRSPLGNKDLGVKILLQQNRQQRHNRSDNISVKAT